LGLLNNKYSTIEVELPIEIQAPVSENSRNNQSSPLMPNLLAFILWFILGGGMGLGVAYLISTYISLPFEIPLPYIYMSGIFMGFFLSIGIYMIIIKLKYNKVE
jgi:hypothetical protein